MKEHLVCFLFILFRLGCLSECFIINNSGSSRSGPKIIIARRRFGGSHSARRRGGGQQRQLEKKTTAAAAAAAAATTTTTLLSSLNTAWEWLADKRFEEDGEEAYRVLEWIDPTKTEAGGEEKIDEAGEEKKQQQQQHLQEEFWDNIPLYPVPAVYLPHSSTNSNGGEAEAEDAAAADDDDVNQYYHILNNVEPRNIQMAIDLIQQQQQNPNNNDNDNSISSSSSSNSNNNNNNNNNNNPNNGGLFCLVLRATDTGRISKVGTLMKLIKAKPYYSNDDDDDGSGGGTKTISRMVVTCKALEPVTIDSIRNGLEAESRINRLMRSPIYLRANLSSRRCRINDHDQDIMEEDDNAINKIIHQIVNDYNFVRSMYVEGIGQDEIPYFARGNLEKDLPELWTNQMFAPTTTSTDNDDDDDDEDNEIVLRDTSTQFWDAANTWQRLCNTIREGRRINIQSDRNEILIEAMITQNQKKGQGQPLKLPIHIEDIEDPNIHRYIQQMELDGFDEYINNCRMDPVLDFLVLLSQRTYLERIQHLSYLVSRERERLTDIALFGGVGDGRTTTTTGVGGTGTATTNSTTSTETPPPPRRKGAWFE